MINPSAKKAGRLLQVEALLLANYPHAMTQAEIARRMGVDRSTINRYLTDLPDSISMDDDGRLAINIKASMVNLRLNLDETLAVHLGARLMATRMDRHNPHAAAALRKLALAVEDLAPHLHRHLLAAANTMDDATLQRQDSVFREVLETLNFGWATGRKVWVNHQPVGETRIDRYLFSVYFIEPYAMGQSTHVIGRREPPGELRTFKVERIVGATLTDYEYQAPVDFEAEALLQQAWGIWYTERPPVNVRLRFAASAAPRVRESRWHPTESTQELPDGRLDWQAEIAEPREMLPWIRGWGADVEVLEPPELRALLEKEVWRMAAVYHQTVLPEMPNYLWLWAKTGARNGNEKETHALLYHMIDVGQVANALWTYALTDSWRRQISAWLGLSIEDAGRVLGFWVALHDIGKACPGFQRKYAPAIAQLRMQGLTFAEVVMDQNVYHATVSTKVLPTLFIEETLLPEDIARDIAQALGGHHGAWPASGDARNLPKDVVGDATWDAVRRALFKEIVSVFQPPDIAPLQLSMAERNTLLALFSGLTTVADWVGSAPEDFPFRSHPIPTLDYAQLAAQQAHKALERLGWFGWQPNTDVREFTELFSGYTPHLAQQVAIDAGNSLNPPALVIIEAPTGSGKTEMALAIADRWIQTSHQRGLYVAMPTTATSNQMFERLKAFLSLRYPNDLVNIQLAHGQAEWQAAMKNIELAEIGEDFEEGRLAAMSWFHRNSKHTLLAPFGVGTVDQVLLSVLKTKHFFVRLFGLGFKTVIFDEVHAYDTYMSTLFERLLAWLRQIGVSVIILSATLPKDTRKRIAAAYATNDDIELPIINYPRITTVDQMGASNAHALPITENHIVRLSKLARTPSNIVAELQAQLAHGGCAAVICNTVRRAQQVYQALQDAALVPNENLILFHARFPHLWREPIESRVLELFGKNAPQRPERAIVVATQVIEQSLDLDFDFMISDLAPIDLLLQRMGRLHRHARPSRPVGLETPHFVIALPPIENGVPTIARDDVYEAYVLSMTYLAIADRQEVVLPKETEPLIEHVYQVEFNPLVIPESLTEHLRQQYEKMAESYKRAQYEARSKVVRAPNFEGLLKETKIELVEADEQPDIHKSLQAFTRLIEPSVSIVCLHKIGNFLYTEDGPDGVLVDINSKPDPETTRHLLRCVVNVSHYSVRSALWSVSPPEAWVKTASLRDHRIAIFENGRCLVEGTNYELILNRQLGLQIVNLNKPSPTTEY